jgi:hypothetical protein
MFKILYFWVDIKSHLQFIKNNVRIHYHLKSI